MGSGYQGQAMPGEGKRKPGEPSGSPGKRAAMPPASILSPAWMEKLAQPGAAQPRAPAKLSPPLGRAVRGRGSEAGAGYRRRRPASATPHHRGTEGTDEARPPCSRAAANRRGSACWPVRPLPPGQETLCPAGCRPAPRSELWITRPGCCPEHRSPEK